LDKEKTYWKISCIEGDSPVILDIHRFSHFYPKIIEESGCLGMQPKLGSRFYLKLILKFGNQ